MHTYEIPRDKWTDELTSFGENHHRWLASVEILGDEVGAQVEEDDEGAAVEIESADGTNTVLTLVRPGRIILCQSRFSWNEVTPSERLKAKD